MSDPLKPHKHSNNTTAPKGNTNITINKTNGSSLDLSLEQLKTNYPQSVIPAYTYVTDHGVHGPYRLEGVSLKDLITQENKNDWSEVEVLSADGFGNRISKEEILVETDPIMLYYKSNDKMLERKHGLVRLVVPTEIDNALRQIKWVKTINIK